MSQTSAPSPSESEPSFPSSQAAQAGCKDTIHHLIHLKPRESTTYRQQLCGASSPVSHQVPRATRGWRTEWAALAPRWRKQRQWQWRRQQRPWLALTLLEERECDRGGQQEEGLDWGKVGRLMSKDVDQLQQSREGWSAEVRLPRAEQHPWNTGGDPSHGSHLTPPTQGQTYE